MTSPDYRFDGCVIISNRSFYVFQFIGQPDALYVEMLIIFLQINFYIHVCVCVLYNVYRLQKVSSHRLSLVKSIASLPWNVGLAICVSQPDIDIVYTFVLFVPQITVRLIAYLESM